ncbi:hypothetical protein B0T25DRAFT_265036 [Lasiosphaeria hispida]|uniref:Uncharacterized protein n=1 Tax=Lasiosphaeria hispida TaxID=260671 RepID=A0AAJ0HAB0_9PEZI|nr:hypothetical protein B0T25DRAFT_265036 [Lasiosphaeria hispida]
MSLSANDTRVGWVSQPDGRGTFDILWNCLFTSFLCTWVSLHLNVPAQKDSEPSILIRKFRWMFQAILGPEFVLAFATGQRAEAKRSVTAFRAAGHEKWTMRHGFYANMGGFMLHARDSTPFPINAKQVLWLVKHEHLTFPTLSERDIEDKSKADGFAKFATCVQTTWLVVHCICRAVQHLPVTTLELTTVSFVICNLATYFEWSQKPLDVYTPTILTTAASINEILIAAGDAASKPHRQTPLDFIDDQSPSWLLDVQPYFGFRTWARERPLTRFTNDRFPTIGAEPHSIALFFINMAYSAIHALGWNFDFPSDIERLLWRVSSIAIIVTTFIFWMCETYQDGVRLGRWKRWWSHVLKRRGTNKSDSELGGNGSSDEEGPTKAGFIPRWEMAIFIPISVVYTLARMYVVIECFFALRSLPVAAYQDVDWIQFVPHFA